MLISWLVTAQLICIFVFVYAKSKFSHDMAHLDVYLVMLEVSVGLILGFSSFFY